MFEERKGKSRAYAREGCNYSITKKPRTGNGAGLGGKGMDQE